MRRVKRTVCDFIAITLAVLREIFDEAAYSRFLDRSGVTSSHEAYAAFCRERERGSARRPRCC
jgi:hypothetical protein